MKKKVLVMISLLVVTGTFFSFTVNAAGTEQMTIKKVVSTSVNVNGVSIACSVTQFYPGTEGGQYSSAYLDTGVLAVNIVFSNITSNYKYISSVNPKIMLYYGGNSNSIGNSNIIPVTGVVNIENFSDDLLIQIANANSYLDIRPSADWSFRYGFVIPPNTRMCAVANIYIPDAVGQGYTGYYEAVVDSVSFVFNPEVQDTDYIPHGDNTDLLLSLEAIRADLIDAGIGLPAITEYLEDLNTAVTQVHTDITTTVHTDLTNIYNGVADIRSILQGNSTTNDNINNDSASLKTQSDNAHAQEQAYFTQNSQAIQATGLGNYHIGTVEGNGIAAVSDDFTSVWNALNGWNAVYIFSLTLGLALTILRHAPNAISRRQRRKQE